MNVVLGLLILIVVLVLIEPVQAGSDLLVNNVIPSVKRESFGLPVIGKVFASSGGNIESVDGSNINGTIQLVEIPKNLDSQITVSVFGLKPDEQYIAIYHKNFNCEKEINSFEKSIQGAFFADVNGEGKVEDKVKDSVNRIGSVSIRRAGDFGVVGCGRV